MQACTSVADDVYSDMKRKARDAILQLIELEREGEQIDRPLLKNILGIFQEVGMGQMTCYQQDFEAQLLKTTAEYYKRKAAVWIEEDSCPDYMVSFVPMRSFWLLTHYSHVLPCTWTTNVITQASGEHSKVQVDWTVCSTQLHMHSNVICMFSLSSTVTKITFVGGAFTSLLLQIKAEDCLKLEEERVTNYMHQSSRTSLLKEVETELLQQHQTTLLEKEQSGCATLLQDDKVRCPSLVASPTFGNRQYTAAMQFDGCACM